MSPPWKPLPLWKRPGVWLAGAVMLVYLTSMSWFLYRHILGDSVSRPVAYFFTWDMFPYYSTQNRERMAFGKTVSGRYVQLYPGPADQYRLGVSKQFSRVDLLPRPEHEPVRGIVYRPIQASLDDYQELHPDDRIDQVFLVEKVWPHRMNYREAFFQEVSGPGAKREFGWTILEVHTVSAEGKIISDE